jgi:putative DNA primase/helicase
MKFDTVPIELRSKQQWVCWRYEERDGKPTKVPYTPAGPHAKTNDPSTWSSFETVVRAANKFDGIGYVFNGDYFGVDLDSAYDDSNQLKPWAADIVNSCKTYTEISPRGKGLHLLSSGALPEDCTGRNRKYHDGKVEIYSRGRFFTVTGKAINDSTITDQSKYILKLYEKIGGSNGNGNGNGNGNHRKAASSTAQTAEEKDSRMDRALKDPVFSRLWKGDTSGNNNDDSAADLALCNKIAFYFGRDFDLINRLFRQSGLMRDKWERQNYRVWTINKAIDGTDETYSPPKPREEKPRKEGDAAVSPDSRIEPINEPGEENSEDEQPKPAASLKNVVRILSTESKFAGVIWFDDFFRRPMTGNPAREWTDADDLELTIQLQSIRGFSKMSLETARQAAITVAFRNRRNSVKDWLESLQWDQESRLDLFFEDFFGSAGTLYTRAASRNFWLSLVARAFRPGCQADNMIVLEGPQGIRKSSALSIIGGAYFAEMDESVSNYRAFAEQLQGKWLVEIAELDSFNRAEVTRVKSILTNRVDRFRPSYGRHAKDHPRQCIFAGTTNRDDWNRDETGARRFWPISCGEIDLEAIRLHRDQLFAEAVHRYKAGESWWEMPAEETKDEQESRYAEDPWLEIIKEFLLGKSSILVNELLLDCLKFNKDRIGKQDQMRVATCLRRMDWVKKKERIGNDTALVWRPQA